MNRIRDILTCFGPVPVVLSVFWTAACLSAKPVERTEPRYQDTEYLMRQTRLSNDKNERQLYTSDRDRGYSAASYQELNRRIPQEQSANVRQVVTAVQQQEQREIQSVALRYIKKVKDAMTQENVEAQLRQRYESVNQVIDLQRQVNNNRIDVQQAEIRKIEESPEFRTAR
ncbi:MAG: hypothetical protein JW774_12530, partial [Candidatus Aureabacteria bacterium]|nr:hypothetical protein [Candidatus Auribacterota bacterium]